MVIGVRVAFLGAMILIGAAVYSGLLFVFARGFVRRELDDLRRLVMGPASLSGAGA